MSLETDMHDDLFQKKKKDKYITSRLILSISNLSVFLSSIIILHKYYVHIIHFEYTYSVHNLVLLIFII